MNQAKDWYRWASEKKRNARARGEMGKVPRTMGRRGLAGNVGQPNAREIAQAVYDENMLAAKALEESAITEYNARANGWSNAPPKQYARPRDPPRKVVMLPPHVVGGKSHRTRKNHTRSRRGRARTRAHRR